MLALKKYLHSFGLLIHRADKPVTPSKQVKLTIRKAVYFLPSLVLYALGIRFVILSSPSRIGHLVAEIDYFMKNVALGKQKAVKAVLLLDKEKSVNVCLLDYFAPHISVVRRDSCRKLRKRFAKFEYLQVDLREAVMDESGEKYHATLTEWNERPPLLALTDRHKKHGQACLKQLGVPEGSWFVAVHSREAGYDAPEHQYTHDYRNSDIESYRLAVEEVIDRGGWCIRVGDPTMKPLKPFPGFIDYANSRFKNDWMDVFLCASCKMFLGNSSGIALVSTLFGVPSAQANLIPYVASLPPDPANISIPKLLRNQSGELIKFPEIFGSPIAQFFDSKTYEQNGLTVIDNTPEEIRDMTVELLDRIDNGKSYSMHDERLQAIYKSYIRKGHYCYGVRSRIGRKFLSKHAELLGTDV